MKMFLLDVYNNEQKVVEVNGLEDYYKYIGCDLIDIVRRTIGGLTVEIICDDEGLYKENPKPSAIDKMGNVALVGNLLLASGTVIEGNLTELAEEEIEHLKKMLISICTKQHKESYKAFFELDY